MATKHKYSCTDTHWTYGAEFELDDWPRNEPLPDGMHIDYDWSLVNSNGVAVDGPGELYHLGGEILARPSNTVSGVADQLATIMHKWPQITINHRTGVHIHIRVPGLRDDLEKLKTLQRNIHAWMPILLPLVEPIPLPRPGCGPVWKGEIWCYKRWKKQHQYLLEPWRVARQMAARTPREFFEAEALHVPSGRVPWATRPRACVNLRQLLQTDTIEFRHFPGSTSPHIVKNWGLWCQLFLELALELVLGEDIPYDLTEFLKGWQTPKFPPYDHWLETGYRFTSRRYHSKDEVRANIKTWLGRKRP